MASWKWYKHRIGVNTTTCAGQHLAWLQQTLKRPWKAAALMRSHDLERCSVSRNVALAGCHWKGECLAFCDLGKHLIVLAFEAFLLYNFRNWLPKYVVEDASMDSYIVQPWSLQSEHFRYHRHQSLQAYP